MLLCTLTLVGKAGFGFARAGLGCHDFLIMARGFAGFMALIDQVSEG